MARRLLQTLSLIVFAACLSFGLPALAESQDPSAPPGFDASASDVAMDAAGEALAVQALADDPWLAEDGPAVPLPVEVERDQVLASWQQTGASPQTKAAAVRRARLELGLGDLLAPAVVLVRSAPEEEPELHTTLAADLAPGVPSIQMTHARALWGTGDIGAAVHAFVDSIVAAAMHVEARLWLFENLALILVIVVLGSSLAFMLLAALMVFPNAAHDLGDLLSNKTPAFARSAALTGLLLVPLVLGEGIAGMALALFAVGFLYGTPRYRSTLTMAAVLFVVGLHPAAQLASVATQLFEHDPVLESVFAVAHGVENQADLERLREAEPNHLAAAHALAYYARRNGLTEQARIVLDEIAVHHPGDPVMLANRGNVEMRRGAVDAAIPYYKRSAAADDSPTVLFDLAQAYAAAFRMEEVDATLARAQALDGEEVAALSSFGDARLVADLGMPFEHLQKQMITLALAQQPTRTVAATLAPGRLGEQWLSTAGAFLLVALICLLAKNRFEQASVCTRCGHRICTRCEETVWSEDLCEDCHHLFESPEDTDPSLRMARLQALSRREARLDRVWTAVSFLVPGGAGFASKRPDLAMFGLLLFTWGLIWLMRPSGVLVDPMLLGGVAWLFFAIPGTLALLGYAGVVYASHSARKNL